MGSPKIAHVPFRLHVNVGFLSSPPPTKKSQETKRVAGPPTQELRLQTALSRRSRCPPPRCPPSRTRTTGLADEGRRTEVTRLLAVSVVDPPHLSRTGLGCPRGTPFDFPVSRSGKVAVDVWVFGQVSLFLQCLGILTWRWQGGDSSSSILLDIDVLVFGSLVLFVFIGRREEPGWREKSACRKPLAVPSGVASSDLTFCLSPLDKPVPLRDQESLDLPKRLCSPQST